MAHFLKGWIGFSGVCEHSIVICPLVICNCLVVYGLDRYPFKLVRLQDMGNLGFF